MKSPIEEMMFEVLKERASFDAHEDPPTAAKSAHRRGVLETLGFASRLVLLEFSGGWSMFRELPIGRFRADFAFVSFAGLVAVECDGHNFHDRTPEQAEHDRSRDRFLAKNGWRTLRFTGREIVRDAVECVGEIFDMLEGLDNQFIADWEALRKAARTGSHNGVTAARILTGVER